MKPGARGRAWVAFALLASCLAAIASSEKVLAALLGLAFPGREALIYPRAGLAWLLGEHLVLVLASSLLSAGIGLGAGIIATRRGSAAIAPVIERLGAAGQTFPPAAVLALSVPVLGFGFAPTLMALFLYGLLPVLRNTMSGIAGVPPEAMDAARGMGMGRMRILFKVELPLAWPVILAGLRTSVIVNIGTAAVGATIGAGGLGAPIISGLVAQQPSYLAEGALAVSLLALSVDALFAAISPRGAAGLRI